MNILLTGSSGFIGNFFKKNNTSYKIIPFSLQYDDIESFDFSTIDTIVHLAALVHQMNGADPKKYQEINVTKTLQLAQKAKHDGVKQFIFMSTVKVYGEESDTVYTETTPCNPQDDYGKSKLLAEVELSKLCNEHFTVSIIRTPIVYGAGVKGNIKNLIDLIQKIPILPLGNTHNQRSMVYVGNLCALIECVAERRAEGIFLASDDTVLSTSEFIRKIASTLEKKLYLAHIPLFETVLKFVKPAFYQRLYGNLTVDSTQTKAKLEFHNPYTTDEGINTMLKGDCQ